MREGRHGVRQFVLRVLCATTRFVLFVWWRRWREEECMEAYDGTVMYTLS